MGARTFMWATLLACSFGAAVHSTAQADDAGATSEIEKVSTATEAEMVSFVGAANSEMRGIVKSLSRLDEQARGQDEAGLLCLTNNLTAARALFQVAEKAEGMMKEALDIGERPRAEHEYRKVAIALKKARLLYAEAERCAGDGVSDGINRRKIEGQPIDADKDETEAIPDDILNYGFDPPDASPF